MVKYPCAFCGSQHWSGECREVKTCAERSVILKKQSRCLRCLSLNHLTERCPATKPCQFCRGTEHNAVLCVKAFGTKKRAKKTIRLMQNKAALKFSVPSSSTTTSVVAELEDGEATTTTLHEDVSIASTSSDSSRAHSHRTPGPTATTTNIKTTMTSRCNNWKNWKPNLTLHTAGAAHVGEMDAVEESVGSNAEEPDTTGRRSDVVVTKKLPDAGHSLADTVLLNDMRDAIEADKQEIRRREQSLRDRERNLVNKESHLKERERKLTMQEASAIVMKVQLAELEAKLQSDRKSVDAAMDDIASERIEMEVERQSWNETQGHEKELEEQRVIVEHLRRQIDDKDEKWKLLKQQLTSTKTTLVDTELQLHRARLRCEEESQRREAAECDAQTLREQLDEARRKVTELGEALQKANSDRRTALRRLANESTKHADQQERDSLELEQLIMDNEVLTWSLEFRAQHTARLLDRTTKMGVEQQTSAPSSASVSASTSSVGNVQQVAVKREIWDIDEISDASQTDASTASAAHPTRSETITAGIVSRMSELLQRYPQKLLAKYIAFIGSNIGFMDSVLLEDLVGFLKTSDPTNGELSDAISAMCTDLCQSLAA